MKKFFKTIHVWLSLPAGLFLFILCITGATMVFQSEIQEAISPESYRVEQHDASDRLGIEDLSASVADVASKDGKTIESITLYSDPSRTSEFGVLGVKGSYYYVNPYTGEITGKGQPAGSFFSTVRSLHRWLLLEGTSRTVGRTIMGISTLFFVVILISGVVIAFPRTLKQIKTALSIKRGMTSFVLWFTSHRALGLYCVIFLFLMCSTGPMWTFPWYKSTVSSIFGIEQSSAGSANRGKGGDKTKVGAQKTVSAEFTKWSTALEEISRIEPNYVSITFSGDKASVKTAEHHQRASDTYKLDRDGHVSGIEKYSQQPSEGKVMGYAFIIHAGLWGGWLVKLIYFLAALGGAYLVISGYVLYIRRISMQKR